MPGLTEADLAALFPSKAKWIANKCAGKIIVYSEGKTNEPLFFHLHGGKGKLLPTVYLLWRYPNALPIWRTPADVWRRLKNGADLMLPGVIPPKNGVLGEFKTGVARAVAIVGNPHALGIGITAVSSDDIKKNGMSGKGLILMHLYYDHLYGLGSKSRPNEGFLKNKVVPLQEEEESEGEGEGEGEEAEEKKGATEDEKKELEAKAEAPELTEEEIQEMKDNMDEAITDLFFRAIVTIETLPIPANDLYTDHMLPRLRKNQRVEFKKSSYKKLANFMKAMEKDEVILLKQRKDGTVIAGINRGHQTVEEYEEKAAYDKIKGKNGKQDRKKTKKRQPGRELEVKLTYMPQQHLRDGIFRKMDCKKKLVSISEARKVIWRYVKENELETPDRKSVKIDPIIRKALLKKNDKLYHANTMSKKELAQKLTQAMQVYHLILFDDDDADDADDPTLYTRGDAPTILIQQGQRQGTKVVTMVEGLEAWQVPPKELASFISKKKACSTTTQNVVRKKKEIRIVIAQGSLTSEVQQYLIHDYGIPSKYVEVSTKTTKAPKKQKNSRGSTGPSRAR
eukprot:CAMPEP_0167755934 /NCGR_PEP_ID=MMETSP0110_2-20121227/9094_1 /TAXON_ID=629695 /ORGANISM="Gymnochlora sp., Strain CCMP2014" /LENGTH=565 /DNA_ID=CAMNT_0007641965 /DNA_START=27 /DNA_END=1721 /DNA_ORIENTATION=+